MKFSCEKSLLFSGISIASRTVSLKNGIAALEGIYVAAGVALELTGYNLETGITVSVPAFIREQGECVFPAKLFAEIIRRLPDEMVEIEVDDNYKVNIKCGDSDFHISSLAPDDYPELPEVDSDRRISIPQNELKRLVSGTLFSVSDNQARPIHTGCLFEVEDTSVTVVAVDGFRLARCCYHPQEGLGRTMKFVAPGAALRELEKILTDTEDPAWFTLGSKHLMFQVGECVLICRLLEGEFLDWRRVLPSTSKITMAAKISTLMSSIERVSLLINEKEKKPLRCHFGENKVEFKTMSTIGNAKDTCPLAGDGKDIEIGFNNRYLLDALRAIGEQETILGLNDNLSPIVMRPTDSGDSYTYMVLPIRLKAGE